MQRLDRQRQNMMRQDGLTTIFYFLQPQWQATLTQGMGDNENNNNFNTNNDSNYKKKSKIFFLKSLLFAKMTEIDVLSDDVINVKDFYAIKTGNRKDLVYAYNELGKNRERMKKCGNSWLIFVKESELINARWLLINYTLIVFLSDI